MLTRKPSERAKAYRLFLRSRFWKELSLRVRSKVGRCQWCKRKGVTLQAHHIRYPEDWYKTTEDDLKVLCRGCHRRAHRKNKSDRNRRWHPSIMIHRNDWRFSIIVHRIHQLFEKVHRGKPLRDRDLRFLDNAKREYPATPTNRYMQFITGHLVERGKLYKEFGCPR
jgi:hypothetical protein